MPESNGTYDVVVVEGVEHLFPVGDESHGPSRLCPCDPLAGADVRTEETVWFHRTQATPL